MALIRCTECATQVSESALVCPRCGCPVPSMRDGKPLGRIAEVPKKPGPIAPSPLGCQLAFYGFGLMVLGIVLIAWLHSPGMMLIANAVGVTLIAVGFWIMIVDYNRACRRPPPDESGKTLR